MKFIVDASALLALILGERGADMVALHIRYAAVSSINLSEVMLKLQDLSISPQTTVQNLERLEVRIANFDVDDAIRTATLRPATKHLGLSFADRACLALAQRLTLPVLTADRDWAKLELGLDIRLIRD